ncbi:MULTISPECIES: CusA/CzcA family heavy metal efflux RND transporter [unclassified Acinetobacter]|uniref:efflux RND transporter permease subunit n=1 Tax=unclassified Acinetobacter TaxID=196816 RepID=UPI002934C8DA|nr:MULTISPECIES: CusA/CzcA family heavy metal efflux RND transporter [unclassified Acinetobacter]WOE31516.1 CusA/CzcA family heavy metal efflux RND transporter [Acinetobacter sp. SAAs470]WOE39712.1 CusA/CzcA family heavy metal efflux RND transporter [Acinetobacter sp. SAAs474]
MLKRIIAFSLSQRILVLLIGLAISVAGYMAFTKLPIDAFPDVSSTQVQIVMKSPGMTPEEVESRIVVPIEQEMLGIPHQTVLRSQSKYAIAIITLDFAEGTDPYWARQQVNERLNGVISVLPSSASGGIAPMTTPLGESFMFTLHGPLNNMEKRTLLDRVIRPQLRKIEGVADVNALGGLVQTFEVIPNLAALAARGLSLNQLQQAIELNNASDGAGRLNENGESLLIRSDSRISTLAELGDIIVSSNQGVLVQVKDVATVRTGALTRYGAVTENGQGEAVEGIVLSLKGANARQVVQQVREHLQEIEKTLPAGTTIEPFYDRGELVNRAIHTVSKTLFEAIILVLILLLLFLGNLRSALVVAVILPLSALSTFLMMYQFGLSANLMSLGGLTIAIGLLVDAAVVVVENIEMQLAEAYQSKNRAFLPILNVIYRAVCEVSVPVTAGMIIIMLVFIPLMTLEGLEGKLFAPVALTIVFALSSSLFFSLTLIPVLCSFFLKPQAHHTSFVVRQLEAAYSKILNASLANPKKVYVMASVALLAAILTFPLIGKSFMPTMDEGDTILQLEKIPSISLQNSIMLDLDIQQRILKQVPEVKRIVARTGSDELGLDPMGLNETDSFIVLKPQDQWNGQTKQQILEKIRYVLNDVPGVNLTFSQPIEMRTSEMLSGVRGDLAVKIFGTDLDQLNELSKQIAGILQGIEGSEDVMTLENSGVQYQELRIHRDMAVRNQLDSQNIQAQLKMLIEGKEIGSIIQQGRPIPLMIKGDPDLSQSSFNLSNIALPIENAAAVPLLSLAEMIKTEGVVKIDRENASRMSVVRSNVRDRDLVGFVDEAKLKVAEKIQLPAGYHLKWGGQFENQQRAAARLMLVVPAASTMIFFLLFTTLGSVRQAVLVFSNIPFALIGGVLALAITGEYLSVPASVGFIALMGIAVLNGLVMISYFNQLIARGVEIEEVVREGAMRRLRPVMMTASIAAFGLIPLLFTTGPGAEIQRPLAIVVIGGLVSCTLLTLILLPNLFKKFGLASDHHV